jgi:hypothetical protein
MENNILDELLHKVKALEGENSRLKKEINKVQSNILNENTNADKEEEIVNLEDGKIFIFNFRNAY